MTYKRTNLKLEALWKYVPTAFRPHTVRRWTRANLIDRADLLTSRDVFVDDNRSLPHTECLIYLLYRTKYVDSNGRINSRKTTPKNTIENDEESEVATRLQYHYQTPVTYNHLRYQDQTPVSVMRDDSADNDPAPILSYAVSENDRLCKVVQIDSDPSPSDPSDDD